jgi:Flp pilus assembly protein TadD
MRPAVLVMLLSLLPAAARADSGDSQEQLKFGIAVARKGLWTEARFRFERAAQLDPQNAAAFNNLAVALEQQGDFDRAREAYDKALALRPGDTYVQQNYDLFREADDKRKRKNKQQKNQP